MPVALLIAPTAPLAEQAATNWGWWSHNVLRGEYRRPDTNEIVRFLYDMPGTTKGLSWGTTVYFAEGCANRRDWEQIKEYLAAGIFIEGDPHLPPPRPRRRKDAVR